MPSESDGTLSNSILISRNKHWKYISSYHGPWLQLPIELLESLFLVNTNVSPNVLGQQNPNLPSTRRLRAAAHRLQGSALSDPSNNPLVQALVAPNNENRYQSSLPSPIDPTAFRNVIAIRRLVDDAADLAIRAASSEPFTAGTFADTISNSSGHINGNTTGLSPYQSLTTSGGGKGGRGCKGLSQVRQQRLRELAVSKMALAYRIDEVATAVVTMQSASALEDVAAKVLKRNPNFLDAIYVNFFHEKIPSRMLCQSTSTEPLDHLIAQCPSTPEYYRTRGIVKCFLEDFPSALRDFKTAIAYARHRRKQVSCHEENKSGSEYANAARSVIGHGYEEEECAGTETQILFFRAACFLQYAVSLIERVMQGVEQEHAQKEAESLKSNEPATTRDIVEEKPIKEEPVSDSRSNSKKNKEGKSEKKSSGKSPIIRATTENFLNPRVTYNRLLPSAAYREALAPLAPQIANLARRAARDYEHFLTLFPSTRGVPPVVTLSGLGTRLSSVSETVGSPNCKNHSCSCTGGGKCVSGKGSPLEESKTDPINGSTKCNGTCTHSRCSTRKPSSNHQSYDFATYHPLLVESYHGCLLAHCLLAVDGDAPDFLGLWHRGSHRLENATEGYPVFLAARSMAQADYIEVVERTRKYSEKKATREMESVALSNAVANGYDTDRKPSGWWKWWTEDEAVSNCPTQPPFQLGIENGDGHPDFITPNDSNGTNASTKTTTTVTTTTSKKVPPSTNSTSSTNGYAGSTVLRQYPMHTSRADTINVWLQAVAIPAWIQRQAGLPAQDETVPSVPSKKKTSAKRKKRRAKKVEVALDGAEGMEVEEGEENGRGGSCSSGLGSRG